MKEDEAIEFFKAHLVAAARQMPMHEAVVLLRGALALCANHAGMIEVQRAYSALVVADDQLELIAHPQGRLFDGKDGQ